MVRVTVSLTRKLSVEMHDGRWESVEAACAIEDEVPQGTDRDSFAAGLRVYVKAVVDDTMAAHKEELMSGGDVPYVKLEGKRYPLSGEMMEASASDEVDASLPNAPKVAREETPPLPTDYQGGRGTEPAPGEEVRVPLDEDTGEELVSFKVDWFMVHESEGGSIYAKVHGGTVKKYGASVWGEVMEALVDISDMESGFRFNPPYPVKAFCTTSEKGFPNKVKYFERTK